MNDSVKIRSEKSSHREKAFGKNFIRGKSYFESAIGPTIGNEGDESKIATL